MDKIISHTPNILKIGGTLVAITMFIGGIMIKDESQDGKIRSNTEKIAEHKVEFEAKLNKFEEKYERERKDLTARMDAEKKELQEYMDKMEKRLIYRLDKSDNKIDKLMEMVKTK